MSRQIGATAANEDFLKLVGAELRSIRLEADLPLAEVGDLFGWGRDALSKIELGLRGISLHDYLKLMHFYREIVPNHPAVALAAYFRPTRSKRRQA